MNRNLIYSLVFVVMAIVSVYLFWKNTLIISLLILVLFFFKHKLIPIKKEELWFIIAALIGALGESVIMISGPWVYSVPEIINFPLWLPLLWGLAGTVGISLYQGVTEK